MQNFDGLILTFVNQFSQHSWLFDKTMLFLSNNHLVKAGFVLFLIWYFWFKPGAEQDATRRTLTAAVISSIAGIFIARALALLLPFRLRPIHEESVHFLMPYGMDVQSLHGWSSFPSDHAVLYFSLSAGIYLVSRTWGLAAVLYTAFFVAFPRLYLGLHYPTDLLFGMLFGMANVWLMNRYFANGRAIRYLVDGARDKPQYFYPIFAMLSFQLMEMFDSVRLLVGAFFKSLLH